MRKENYPSEEEMDGYLEGAPDLCIEIVSPQEKWENMQEKVNEYLAAGVRLIWIIQPVTHDVRVFRANGSSTNISESGTLSGESVLPGFALSLAELFAAI